MQSRKPGTFQHGNKIGACPKPGSGRTPEWLKEKCREFIEKDKLVEFLSSVANGSKVRDVFLDNGSIVPCAAEVKDRMKATEILLDRGFGKAPQDVNLNGSISFDLVSALMEERGKRGIDASKA